MARQAGHRIDTEPDTEPDLVRAGHRDRDLPSRLVHLQPERHTARVGCPADL